MWKKGDTLWIDCGRGICCWQVNLQNFGMHDKSCTQMFGMHECTVLMLDSFEEGRQDLRYLHYSEHPPGMWWGLAPYGLIYLSERDYRVKDHFEVGCLRILV